MDAAMLSMTARMSANCSSVDIAVVGSGGHGGSESGLKDGEQWRWWGLVVGCAAVEKFGSEYQDVMAWAIRAKSKVIRSQLGQDQFFLDSFQLSSALYSRLTQS
jgi:hypothetical protein